MRCDVVYVMSAAHVQTANMSPRRRRHVQAATAVQAAIM
jgi:hypothetical protein